MDRSEQLWVSKVRRAVMKHLKKIPTLNSDVEAEQFVEKVDLTEYDLSDFQPISNVFGLLKDKTTRATDVSIEEMNQAVSADWAREK